MAAEKPLEAVGSGVHASVPRLPAVIGDQELLALIAKGGMGSVYLSRSMAPGRLNRRFAVKVLHSELAVDRQAVEMLFDEARLAAGLHHPNTVPVLDMGYHGSIPYLVMDYIEGGSLLQIYAATRGAHRPDLLLPIVIGTLRGLDAAHKLRDHEGNTLNLVHRDVSPHNILVSVDGTARLTDFGIAKADGRMSNTREGVRKGKLAYMAPEQFLRPHEVDHRADIFSAGVVLWGALTGRALFTGETPASTMYNVLHRTVPPPSQVGLRPPPFVDDICLRALARDPDERYQSAAEMALDLREAALRAGRLCGAEEVGAWVKSVLGEELERRDRAVRTLACSGVVTLDHVRQGTSSFAQPSFHTGEHTSPRPAGRRRRLLLLGLSGVLGGGLALFGSRPEAVQDVVAKLGSSAPSRPVMPSTPAPTTPRVPAAAEGTPSLDAHSAPVQPRTTSTSISIVPSPASRGLGPSEEEAGEEEAIARVDASASAGGRRKHRPAGTPPRDVKKTLRRPRPGMADEPTSSEVRPLGDGSGPADSRLERAPYATGSSNESEPADAFEMELNPYARTH